MATFKRCKLRQIDGKLEEVALIAADFATIGRKLDDMDNVQWEIVEVLNGSCVTSANREEFRPNHGVAETDTGYPKDRAE